MTTNLIVDSGVAVKWFVPEPHAAIAQRLFVEYLTGRLSFCAPDLIYAEFGNIMWKKQAFHGYSPSDAAHIVREFRSQISITTTSSASLLEDAYRLAALHKRTVYDSLYLALSQRLICQFVTADERLVNAIGGVFPTLFG